MLNGCALNPQSKRHNPGLTRNLCRLYVAREPSSTTREIADSLGLEPLSAAYMMRDLRDLGEATSVKVYRKKGKGGPINLWVLTDVDAVLAKYGLTF